MTQINLYLTKLKSIICPNQFVFTQSEKYRQTKYNMQRINLQVALNARGQNSSIWYTVYSFDQM